MKSDAREYTTSYFSKRFEYWESELNDRIEQFGLRQGDTVTFRTLSYLQFSGLENRWPMVIRRTKPGELLQTAFDDVVETDQTYREVI